MMYIFIYAGIALVGLVIFGLIIARLYKRASKEVSFVRTGMGGEKVIMNGGAMVLPILHETIPVNMNTLRLEVKRAADQALITRDRMRVDVMAEFYVRVKPTTESIATAAQTLGMKTMSPEELKNLVEGKFVDSLRSVAAEMAMEELHEKRVDFVQKVQQVVSEDLFKNGLELETVSLTGLDQTSFEFFNPQNAFDAEGLTKLTETIEDRRKKRNDIEQDTDLAIRTKNLEAEQKRLSIIKEEEYAKLQQFREIEVRKAEQDAEVAIRKAEQQAEIVSQEAQKQRESDEATIAAQLEVDLKRISAEQDVKERDIQAKKDIELQSIQAEQDTKNKEIAKAQVVEQAAVLKDKVIKIAEQDKQIAIAEKSREESEAKALADKARATAVKEEEHVITVRETERAERDKAVELVMASQIAQTEAIAITVAAETEKKSAADKAEAIRVAAEADAEKVRVHAKGDADATILRAEAKSQEFHIEAKGQADAKVLLAEARAKEYTVEAEGTQAINEASNILSAEQIEMQVRLALIKHLPEIIRESVKPMESIDDIKILQVNGLGGGFSGIGTGVGDSNNNSSLPDQLVNSALKYRSQAPLIDSLMNELGINGSDLNGLTQGFIAPEANNIPEQETQETQETPEVHDNK